MIQNIPSTGREKTWCSIKSITLPFSYFRNSPCQCARLAFCVHASMQQNTLRLQSYHVAVAPKSVTEVDRLGGVLAVPKTPVCGTSLTEQSVSGHPCDTPNNTQQTPTIVLGFSLCAPQLWCVQVCSKLETTAAEA